MGLPMDSGGGTDLSSVVYLLVNPPGSSEHSEIHGHSGLVKLRGNNKTGVNGKETWGQQYGGKEGRKGQGIARMHYGIIRELNE